MQHLNPFNPPIRNEIRQPNFAKNSDEKNSIMRRHCPILIICPIFPLIPYRKNTSKASVFKETFSIKSKRWKVERTFAWLKRKCRRLMIRWERKLLIWEAFTTLGLTFMWVNNLLR